MKAVGDFVLIQMADAETTSGLRILGYNQAIVLSVGSAASSSVNEGDRIAFLGEAHPILDDILAIHYTDIVAVIK